MFKKITKKVVKTATDAVKEEIEEKVQSNMPLLITVGTLIITVLSCIGSKQVQKPPDNIVNITIIVKDSRGIRRL